MKLYCLSHSFALVLLLEHTKRIAQEILLLLHMHSFHASCYARALVPTRIHDMLAAVVHCRVQESLDARLGEAPGPGIQRFLLAPDDVLGIWVAVEVLL